jgi:iron(III) transport system substrate-binding protein
MDRVRSRRQFLQLVALASGGSLLAACGQQAAPSPTTAAKPTTAPAATTAPAGATAPAATAAPIATVAPPPAAKVGQAVPKDHPTIAALYEAAKKEGKVAWWDQHDPAVAQKFIGAFNKQFPGIEVEFFEATTDVLKTRAVQEARANAVSFDIIDSGENYPAYKDSGIVTDKTDFTELLTLAGVDKQFIVDGTYSPEFTVYGVAYNTNLAKAEEMPDSWAGFADPKWKGKLAIETRLRPFVYGTPWLGGEDKVVELLQKFKENNPRPTNGDTASQNLLVAGEFPVLVGAYLHRAPFMKDKPWAFVSLKDVWSTEPRQGYVVPATAPHANAGKLFMFWFMGPEGQALTDAERFKGNPARGTGTGPSKYLEEHNMNIHFTPKSYEENYQAYNRKYLEALGMPVT